MGCDEAQIAQKVAEGVAAALKEKTLRDELAEYQKQFPKVTLTDITDGPSWQVGDWVVANGTVYEITAAKKKDTETYYNPYSPYRSIYSSTTPEQMYYRGSQVHTSYQLKLKTIPLKGQKSVTGWTDLKGTAHVVIKRTVPGLELKRDNS